MKTYTTVKNDGTPGPEVKADNFEAAELELLLVTLNDYDYEYRVVGEKIKLNENGKN